MKSKQVLVCDEYVVSDRVTLRAGDAFRAKGGPYYIKRDARGQKVRMAMAARGPFRFVRFCEQGKRQWIEAVSLKDGTAAVLSLTKRRSILPGALIPRPYVIVGRVGKKKRAKRAGKQVAPQPVAENRGAATAPKKPRQKTLSLDFLEPIARGGR